MTMRSSDPHALMVLVRVPWRTQPLLCGWSMHSLWQLDPGWFAPSLEARGVVQKDTAPWSPAFAPYDCGGRLGAFAMGTR